MPQTETLPFDLEVLLEAGEAQADAIAKAQAERAREQEHQNLRADRQAAASYVKDRLGVETDPNAWERLELEPGMAEAGFLSRALVLPFPEDPELALTFRQRGITEGGHVLTVLARAEETRAWVGSRFELDRLADLPRLIEDARDRAETWDEDAAELEGDPDLAAAAEEPEPRYRIAGDSLGELLESVVAMVAREHALPYDA